MIAHVEQDVAGKGGGPIPATDDEIQAEIRKQADKLANNGIETGGHTAIGGLLLGTSRSGSST